MLKICWLFQASNISKWEKLNEACPKTTEIQSELTKKEKNNKWNTYYFQILNITLNETETPLFIQYEATTWHFF